MNRTKLASIFTAVGMSFILLVPSIAMAIDWNVTGFVRQEIAVSITNDKNPNNGSTNAYVNNVTPVTTFGIFSGGAVGEQRGLYSASPNTCQYWTGANALNEHPNVMTPGACAPSGVGGQEIAEDSSINLFNTRLEVDIQANNITDSINAYAKIRLYFDGTSNFNDGLVGNTFEEQMYGNRGGLLELNSNDFMIDIPALYFDYNKGPLWIRVGQQQIAWGEALFFRVFDVANGLDLRRHFFLDVAGEEYADERIAAPGIRVSYTFNNGVEIDAFTQMFMPTLFPAMNNPYNLVTSEFSWDNEIEMDEAQSTLQYGMRVIWPVSGQMTVQAMVVNRRNPDGIVRWHDAPATLYDGRPNPFCSGRSLALAVVFVDSLGVDFNVATYGSAWNDSAFTAAATGNTTYADGLSSELGVMGLTAADIAVLTTPTGGLTRTKYTEHGCGSFFAPDPQGGPSASNWYDLAPQARLDSAAAVAASINLTQVSSIETRKGFGLPTETGPEAIARFGSVKGAAVTTLDAFYTGFGNLRGWITREFKRETIFGLGGNYVITMDDYESFWDQMILRGEISYTPNKQFTALNLSHNWIEEDEIVMSVIVEKWHRWTDRVPGMYMVAEWMFKSESDLFGRHLSGAENNPGIATNPDGTYKDDGRPDGSDNFNAVVFAFQQPFPDLIWRLDMAFLLDLEGGWLFQPGVRYRPSANFQFDIYANIIQGAGDANDDIMETMDWADEVFVRATYFF